MKRQTLVLGLLVAVALILIISKINKTPETSDTNSNVPTAEVQQEQLPGDLIDESDPIEPEDKTEPTQAVATISCTSVMKDIESLAKDFMKDHQAKNADSVLGLIASPYTQDEQDQLDYWLGLDDGERIRLYVTPETSYSISTYTLGKITDRGQDADERGSKRCQMAVTETRAITTTTPYSEQVVTRYLDFAVDISGYSTLTAYREGKDGKKYSGF